MRFFRKWKKKKKAEDFLEGFFAEEDEHAGRRQVEHDAISYCERLMQDSRDLEETKQEYRMVTGYLNDIQILEEMPEEPMERIRESARNILSLDKTREAFKNKKRRISDTQYAQIQSLEEEIPGNITRMRNNENYQAMVKRDLDYLEGEKIEWSYYLDSLIREKRLLKLGLWGLFVVLASGICIIGYFQFGMHKNMAIWMLSLCFVVVLLGSLSILRLQQDKRDEEKARKCIHRAVIMSNQMKTKYVSVTNAVDYSCEKFHVSNSMELNFLWEQYLEAVKERENVERTNEDLEYFGRRLMRDLKQAGLYDSSIWLRQCEALVDKREMVEVKHYLIERRQKLRGRMEQQIRDIQDSKEQILLLLKDKKEFHKEIMDVLNSIDQMCGTAPS